MKKYLTITVREQMQGMTVEKVLYDYLELTKKQVSRAKFRPDGICKNKVQCRVTEKVSMGDEICICLETDEIQSAQLVLAKIQGERLRILYEDEDILAVNKPAGVLTHPAGMHYSDSLANQVAAYFQERNLSVCIRPIGRLDKETSGIVLFAKNQVAAQRLQEQRETGVLEKQYLALVDGNLPKDRSCEGGDCKKETIALLTYMLQHNEHHAAELDQMADNLQKMGLDNSAKTIKEAVADFQKGNMRLGLALTLVKEEMK